MGIQSGPSKDAHRREAGRLIVDRLSRGCGSDAPEPGKSATASPVSKINNMRSRLCGEAKVTVKTATHYRGG